MSEFIEKNRRLLHFLCGSLQTVGKVILVLGLLCVGTVTALVLLSKFGSWRAPEGLKLIMLMPLSAFHIFFIGIGLLGLGQFINYIVESDYKPGWILRHGETFFYLYALLSILSVVWAYTIGMGDRAETKVVSVIPVVFITSVKVLVLVGLGRIFRYLMKVVEESKTLV